MKRPELEKLTSLMERLRGPEGCPWDKEQTLNSLVPFIIEEAYEVVSAIDSRSPDAVKEELGDLLFQIIFVSQITKEAGQFDINGVIDESFEKMVRRHPHVFGDRKAETPEEVLKHWAEIKKEEKEKKETKEEGYLSGIPDVLPALLRAHKVTQKAAKAGFDWKDIGEVFEKLTEELNEFRKEAYRKNPEGMEEELGDLLFTIVNISRFCEVNPEDALRKTIGKFINRFHFIEKDISNRGGDLSTTPIEEMERLWQEAKRRENK